MTVWHDIKCKRKISEKERKRERKKGMRSIIYYDKLIFISRKVTQKLM